MKKILITGKSSYLGNSFQEYIKEQCPDWTVDAISIRDDAWKKIDFSPYDCVLHMAGKAHADVGNVSEEVKKEYYKVNYELTKKVAKAVKRSGVKQFIYPGSIIIYGESAPYGKEKRITAATKPAPANFYGDSKWRADKAVQELNDDTFRTVVLRLPMVYGKGSKGNYPLLSNLAKKLPVFPNVENARSMIYIENLCEMIREIIEYGDCGVFYPQNAEYTATSDMVKTIADVSGNKIRLTRLLNPAVSLLSKMSGKIGKLANKAFGNCTYEKSLSEYRGNEYQMYNFETSIRRTEGRVKR
ncbi:MAG: NAD-dependent epimerase/dehydratase family protein [Eubacterium sp.]|jgi:nucleoside-diphosphate-sugar epimerase|nr:NAD-dependent epimerase/dehydratase family protein [Eubacterium sp.]